ncbi:MAG: alpha/beta hydrolase [Spirochaetes bacterium]|nr:alpha/beta hydrolase [Spirochaetota bacterium]
MKKKFAVCFILIGAILYVGCQTVAPYEYSQSPLPQSFDEFYAKKRAESAALNARPGNEERLVRYSPQKTKLAFLYIHGYGASRAEGEYILDKIASQLKANTYYLRLPGHGTNKEDHKRATAKDHLDTATAALLMMEKLGEKIFVVGTSMGGLIATYLAAHYPDRITGTVLVSPFYDFATAATRLANCYPIFRTFVFINPIRVSSREVPPDEDNWTKYWYREQYFISLQQLIDLKRIIARREVYEKITIPVLLLYYYKDENNQDKTASVAHMKEAFALFGKSKQPNPLNRAVAIEEGSHVLMSKYSKTDEHKVITTTLDFISQVAGLPSK